MILVTPGSDSAISERRDAILITSSSFLRTDSIDVVFGLEFGSTTIEDKICCSGGGVGLRLKMSFAKGLEGLQPPFLPLGIFGDDASGLVWCGVKSGDFPADC
jgi:hypothetical protein